MVISLVDRVQRGLTPQTALNWYDFGPFRIRLVLFNQWKCLGSEVFDFIETSKDFTNLSL